MNPTRHALERWAKRFPGQDLAREYRRAMRVGRKGRKAIQAACPGHAGLLAGPFQGFYYLRTPDDIVFVMTAPEKIVTIFQLVRAKPAGAEAGDMEDPPT